MAETTEKKIIPIKAKGTVSSCPECGYKDGFHVALDTPDNSELGEVILICPDCHNHFRIGWKVSLESY